MKTVKIVKITQEELEELTKSHDGDLDSLEKLIEENTNQTLSILRQIKNIYEWKDIEEMVDYVKIIKRADSVKIDQIKMELDNDQHSLVIKVFKGAVASGKVSGFALEKLVQVYKEFKEAE
jgi:hypothetical protein